MAGVKVRFKMNNNEIRTDYINLTHILSFATLCIAQTFHVSSVIYFLIDIPIILMVTFKIKKFIKTLLCKSVYSITAILLFIVIAMTVGGVINGVSLGNAIYGAYKYFRGFVFFYCVLAFGDSKSVKQTFKIFNCIFWINIVLTLIEFFLLGINQDLLGGIFGLVMGVNQYTNLYFVIISVYCIEKIVCHDAEGSEYKRVLIISVLMLAVAALAEIKFFFAEFVLLFMVAYLCLPQKPQTFLGVALILICVIVFYNLLIRMFPEFSTLIGELRRGGLARLIDLQKHYSTDYDIGRAAVFSYSNKYLLPNRWNRLFGMGIGNVTSSNFVDNSFWLKNQGTHYDQFYTSYLYNEQGMIGFLLYCLIYVELLKIGIKSLFFTRTRKYGTMLIMMVTGGIMIFIYNMAMYSQLSFIIFWALAVLVRKCTNSFS